MLFPGCESSIEVGGIMKLSWGVETRYIRVRQSSNLTLVRLARRQLVRFLYKVSEMYTNTVVQQWIFSFFFQLPSSGTHWSYVFCRGRVDNESDALLIYYAAGTRTHRSPRGRAFLGYHCCHFYGLSLISGQASRRSNFLIVLSSKLIQVSYIMKLQKYVPLRRNFLSFCPK